MKDERFKTQCYEQNSLQPCFLDRRILWCWCSRSPIADINRILFLTGRLLEQALNISATLQLLGCFPHTDAFTWIEEKHSTVASPDYTPWCSGNSRTGYRSTGILLFGFLFFFRFRLMLYSWMLS